MKDTPRFPIALFLIGILVLSFSASLYYVVNPVVLGAVKAEELHHLFRRIYDMGGYQPMLVLSAATGTGIVLASLNELLKKKN